MINRGRIEIMAQILAFCAQPRLKTQIMYNANITFRQFETYVVLLSSPGLIARKADEYRTTEKGRKFVQVFNELQSTLGTPLEIASGGLLAHIRHTGPAAGDLRQPRASLQKP